KAARSANGANRSGAPANTAPRSSAGNDEQPLLEITVDRSSAPRVRVACSLPLEDETFREIVHEFSEKLQIQVDRMKMAYAAERWAELLELAYWLKGSGGTAGYEQFTIPSSRLERLASQHSHDRIEAVLCEIDELAKAVAAELAALPVLA